MNKNILGGKNKDLRCGCGKLRFPGQDKCPLCFFLSLDLSEEEAKRRAKVRLSRAYNAVKTGHYHHGSRKGMYYWNEEDPIGVKKNHLVRYLMKQGVPNLEARLIASRKYR